MTSIIRFVPCRGVFAGISLTIMCLAIPQSLKSEVAARGSLTLRQESAQPFFQRSAQPLFGGGNQPFIAPARQNAGLFDRRQEPLFGPRREPRHRQAERAVFAPASEPQIHALIANPPRSFNGLDALGCLAVSIYHEARNQPPAGQYAVGSVILTRAANPDRWGGTACAVVQPVQFSYLTASRQFAPILEQNAWETAVLIAAQVLRDGPAPALKGADHYHATYVSPDWNQAMVPVGRIADHIFWRSRSAPGRSRAQ